MTVALLALSGLFWWRDLRGAVYVAIVGGGFAILGLAAPRMLAPIESLWTAFSLLLGEVLSRVVLALTYFLVVTPIGLVMRLTRNDPLARSFDPDAESYWIPVEPDGPGTRPDKPF